MRTSDGIGSIAAALSKAQGQIKNAVKDAANPFFKSAYAPLDTVIDAIKASLAANEIAYVQSPAVEDATVKLTTLLLHSSGQWLESDPVVAKGKDASPQSVGSCITYLRRYSLMAMVGIAASDDDDAEAAHGRDAPPAKPQPPKPAPSKTPVDLEALKKSLGERMARCKSTKEFDVSIRPDIPKEIAKDMAPTVWLMQERLAGEGDVDAEHACAMREAAKSKNGKEAA